MRTHYAKLASASPVDGAHVRGLLASNHAAAEAARRVKAIEDNFSVTISGDEMVFTLTGDTAPVAYVAAAFGESGEIEAVARPGLYDVEENDLRAFEAAAMNRARRNAQSRAAADGAAQ